MADKQKTDQEPKQEGNLKKQMQDQIDAACFANSAKASVEKLLESTTSLQNNIEQHAKVFSEIGRTRPYIQQILESIENNVSIYEAAYNYAYFKQYLKLDVTTGKEPTSKELDNYATAFLNLFIEEIENASEELLNANIKELVMTEQIEVDGEQRAITWLNDETPIKEIIATIENSLAERTETAPKVMAKKPNGLYFAVDKVNSTIWRLFADEKGQIPGQISFAQYSESDLIPIKVEGENDKENSVERSIYYAIDFSSVSDNLTISKRLTAFDRRVYEAIGTLYNFGNDTFSITQIYKSMGNNGSPAPNQIKRISESIEKMASAIILLDRTQDYEKYINNSSIDKVYRGNLLYIEEIKSIINGQLVESAIHLLREPVLMQLAREKKQITRIPRAVIETNKRQTENNLEIENYLLERIARMKNGTKGSSNKILYETIFEKANIEKGKQRQRAIKTIFDYLNHYKKNGWIIDFNEVDGDGIEIKYVKSLEREKNKRNK